MLPASEINGGKKTVNFASLPRELRDEIYDLALISDEVIEKPVSLRRCEQGTRGFDLHPSYALLSVKASSLQIALEARETFFRHNTFVVYASALSDFLSGNTGHINGPGRFDISPWISKLQIELRGLTYDQVRVEKPARMISQFQLLQKCPSLRSVNIYMSGAVEMSKPQFVHTLQSVCFSCEDLHSRLGHGLELEFELKYYECDTHYKIGWSGRYDELKQLHERMTDDDTRRELLSAADWAEARGESLSGNNDTQNGDADAGN